MHSTPPAKQVSDLAAEVRFARLALYSRRSDKLVRLLDYLLECAVGGITPHRGDIARALLTDGGVLDVRQQEAARVYVHRLRRKLDDLYHDRPGPRLCIPKGEYRILLADDGPTAPVPDALARRVLAFLVRKKWRLTGAALLALNIVAWDGGLLKERRAPALSPLAATRLWRPLASSDRPTTIVFGDHYLFADAVEPTRRGGKAPRLILDPSIRSREDLDLFLIRHPDYSWQWGTDNLTYAPADTIVALQDVLAAMRGLGQDCCGQADILSASRLTPDILKNSNIVYVGLLSGLPPLLRSPLFQASGFRIGASYADLIDGDTARHFRPGEAITSEGSFLQKSYGYIAGLPGPSDNHLVIIAGADGRALREMAETVNMPAKLARIDGQAKGRAGAFETLYQVDSAAEVRLGQRLLIERPLHPDGVWDISRPVRHVPDEMSVPAGRQPAP